MALRSAEITCCQLYYSLAVNHRQQLLSIDLVTQARYRGQANAVIDVISDVSTATIQQYERYTQYSSIHDANDAALLSVDYFTKSCY